MRMEFPDVNAMVSGGPERNPAKLSDGQQGSSVEGIEDRVNSLEDQKRVQLLKALYRTPAAPPPPERISYETPGVGAVKLTWKPVDDPRVYGYNVYGSSKNNPKTMGKVGFLPQVPDPTQGVVVFVDTITPGDIEYYYVAAVNKAGKESARIPLHLGVPPATSPSGGFDVNGAAVPPTPNLIDGAIEWTVAGSDILGNLGETFITVGANTILPNSRELLAGTGVQLTDNGVGSSLVINTVPGYVFIERKVAYTAWDAVGGGSWPTKNIGDEFVSGGGGLSSVVPTATEPILGHFLVGVINTETWINGQAQWNCGLDLDLYCRVRLNTVVVERFWCALIDTDEATMFPSDTQSTKNVAAFRFSTSAGDANFQSVVNNGGGGTQVVKDTGVAPSTTNTQLLHISFRKSTGYVTFYINETQVTQHTTVVPASTAQLRFIVGIRALENVAKTWDLAQVYIEQRRPIP